MMATKRDSGMVMERTQSALDFIIQYKRDHDGCSPSYSQIGDSINVKSKSLARFYVLRLQEQGKIKLMASHQIAVVGGRWLAPGEG